MKIEETRLKQLIVIIAMAFYWKAKTKQKIESSIAGIIDVVGDTLLHNNAFPKMTFIEAIVLVSDHEDDILNKIVDIAHTNNDTDSCDGCALVYLCHPEHEEVKELTIDDELRKIAINFIQHIQNQRDK